MPKRQLGSRSSRKKGVLLDYARRDTISLTVSPVVELAPLVLKTVEEISEPEKPEPDKQEPDKQEIDCKPPVDEERHCQAIAVPSRDMTAVQEKTAAPPATATAPKMFGSYELCFEIGKDALSTTYVAKHPALEGFLSLRIFNERITDSSQVRSIQKAALKAGELTHPNHVCVYENGIGDNQAPFVVTEWIEGETLTDLFQRKKRLDIAAFLNIFNQTCDVLAEAHSRRLVHGNLSPQKIILSNNEIEADIVKVIDFGMPVDPVQNAFYMSPEECLDRDRISARSDIYSLGCIMYESLVGRPPSLGSQASANSVDFLHELANQYSKDSQEHNALKLLDCIIKRCLQKQPSRRFSSVRELMNALALVADCFDRPGNRKLPPKAEKLLLFRFLDLFDKKITAALTAYLLLGLFATKYIGEIQLQKFIDEAQMARFEKSPNEQANWLAAIEQARKLGKPPSLQAELHWELGDTYRNEALDTSLNSGHNNLAKEAIKQYEQAYQYYKIGPHYQSYALGLLQNMGQLWTSMGDDQLQVEKRDTTLAHLTTLWNSKNYAACAQAAEKYSSGAYDSEIYLYAAKANMELGKKLAPQKALTYFARAAYYFQDPSQANPGFVSINKSLEKMHLMWQFGDTHTHFACLALLAGDTAAASGFMQGNHTEEQVSEAQPALVDLLDKYRQLRWSVYSYVERDPNKQQAIQPLERELQIAQAAYGKYSDRVSTILSSLAKAYLISGEKQKAIDTYQTLFSTGGLEAYTRDQDLLAYSDLLAQTDRSKLVSKLLEKRLLINGALDTNDPLFIRLIQAYTDAHMNQKAQDALDELIETPKAVVFNPQYQFGYIPPKALQKSSDMEVERWKEKQKVDPFLSSAPIASQQTTEVSKEKSTEDANF